MTQDTLDKFKYYSLIIAVLMIIASVMLFKKTEHKIKGSFVGGGIFLFAAIILFIRSKDPIVTPVTQPVKA